MVAAGGWVHTDFLQWWYYQFHFDPLWRVSSGASLGCDLSFSHSRQINYRFFLHFKDLDGRVSAPMCIGGAPALVHYLQCRKRKPKWRREQPTDILQSVVCPKSKQTFSKFFIWFWFWTSNFYKNWHNYLVKVWNEPKMEICTILYPQISSKSYVWTLKTWKS